jgi:hypothetical protein
MKINTLKNTVLALALAAFAGTSAQGATLSYTQGDLLMGFYATAGTGQTTNYVLNLGNFATYRDNSPGNSFNLSLGNVGADLTAIFGSGWDVRSDLFWGVFGHSGTTTGVDPANTLYAGQDAALGTGYTRAVSSQQGATINGNLNNIVGEYNGANSTANSNVGQSQDTTLFNNEWVTQANQNINGAFGRYDITEFNAVIGQDLNLYRMLRTTVADPDNGNATLGQGSLQGTFSISSGGVVSFSTIPEPSTYALIGLGLGGLTLLRRYKNKKTVKA